LETLANSLSVTVIVPVYNGGAAFKDCLSALLRWKPSQWTLVVVDDGSTDGSGQVAKAHGAIVFKTSGRLGPGAARNIGAQNVDSDYLCFIDADCEVNSRTFANIALSLADSPDIDALFGSYDETPSASNFVAQYKNLMHRYVHQTGNEDATTFWAGCGVVRRSVFMALGGFDTRKFRKPSIEDIHLGYRIKAIGGKIKLDKTVTVKHYKAWQFWGLMKVDIFDRGIPWTRLLLEDNTRFVNDLNLAVVQRLCVVAAYLGVVLAAACPFRPDLIPVTLLMVAFLVISNIGLYKFFARERGIIFAAKVLGMQWLYYLYCGVAFAGGWILHTKDRLLKLDRRAPVRTAPKALPDLTIKKSTYVARGRR